MGLSERTVRSTQVSSGGTDFALPDVPIVDDSAEVKVYLRDESVDPVTETLQEEGALNDYTLVGAPDADSFHTTVRFNSAVTSGLKVVISLELPRTQTSTFTTSIAPGVLTQELNRIVGMLQEVDDKFTRVPLLSIGEQISEANMELGVRGNYILGWNAAGTALQLFSPTEIAAAAAAINGTDDIAEGSTNLYYTWARVQLGEVTEVALPDNATTSVSNLIVDENDFIDFEFSYRCVRNGSYQLGKVRCYHDGTDWQIASHDKSGNVGVSFSINAASGQVSATTTNTGNAATIQSKIISVFEPEA